MRERMKQHFWILLTAALSAAFLFAGCGEGKKSYEEGIASYNEGRYEEAIRLYELAISQGEKKAVVYADLALAYDRYGNAEKAEEMLNQARNTAPKDREVLRRAGIFSFYREDYETAIRFFEQALPDQETKKMSESDVQTLSFLAESKKKLGKTAEAIELYQSVILAGYHTLEQKLFIGECLLMEHEFYAARTYFDWAFEEPSVRPEHYLYVYRIATEAEDYLDAERYFQAGLKVCSKETMTEGEYYANAGKYAAAIERLTDETTTGAYLARASIALQEKRYREAEEYYQILLKRGEELPVVYNQYMILKAVEGDFDAAKQLLSQIRAFKDPSIEEAVAWNEIILYELQRDYKTAYEKLLEYMKTFQKTTEAERELLFLSRALQP